MNVVAHDILEFGTGKFGLIFREVNFRKLNFRARVGMTFYDALPDFQGGVRLVQRRQSFRKGHERVAEVVLVIFAADGVEQRACLGGTFQPQQALAEMRAGVNVRGVAGECGAVTFLRLGKFSFLKINVAKLEMMIGIVNVVDFRLKLLDARTALRAGQFEAGGSRTGLAIDGKKIPERANAVANENKNRPDPFAVAERVNEHPKLKHNDRQRDGTGQQIAPVVGQVEQRGEHSAAKLRPAISACNKSFWRN